MSELFCCNKKSGVWTIMHDTILNLKYLYVQNCGFLLNDLLVDLMSSGISALSISGSGFYLLEEVLLVVGLSGGAWSDILEDWLEDWVSFKY